MSLKLEQRNHFPEGLAHLELKDIQSVVPGPMLIHIEGRAKQPLFVSTLLHGNEATSFDVLKHLNREYSKTPPRSLLIFIGNVDAASAGVRRLDNGPDFNRIWSGGANQYHKLASEVTQIARQANLFASIDIHNNTGANPLYGCVNTLRPADLELAAMFAKTGVYYLNPPTTQSIAFSRLCPSVTVECGKSGDPDGVAAAINLVEGAMRLEDFEHTPPSPADLLLYETIGRVLVDPDASIAFDGSDADLVFRPDLESRNFKHMQDGELWGHTSGTAIPLRVVNEHNEDLTSRFFIKRGEEVVLARDAVPSMITTDLAVIRQDCLCYLMAPL